MDGLLEESAVELVDADIVDEKDSEAGLFMGVGNIVEARGSRPSGVGSITYDVTICGGKG
jgi:hypothetical protein